MGDLDLQARIEYAYTPGGLLVAKDHVDALAAASNKAAAATTPLNDGIKQTGASANVARNQIAAMAAVVTRSIGFSGQAGAAARVASAGFVAMGDAAQLANLKMAGVTLGLSILIPLLVEWIVHSKEASKETDELAASVAAQLPSLEQLADQIGTVSDALQAQIDATHRLALGEQDALIEKNTASIEEHRKEIERLVAEIHRFKNIQEQGPFAANQDFVREQLDKFNKELEQHRNLYEQLIAVTQRMREAKEKGLTLEQAEARAISATARALREKLKAERDLKAWKDKEAEVRKRNQEKVLDQERKAEDEKQDMIATTQAFLRKYRKEQADAAREKAADDAEADANSKAYNASLRAEWGANVGAGLAAASQLFGGNKAVAIAGAIADTYAAANKAIAIYGPTPLGYAAMASAIIQGLANVANIRKADAGFDDPVNDAIAVSFGRKFANDVVGLISVGFNQTLAGQARQSAGTTINRGMTVNGGLHLGGFFGSNETQLLKTLERKLTTIRRLERRASL